jgi:hypothetical protein
LPPRQRIEHSGEHLLAVRDVAKIVNQRHKLIAANRNSRWFPKSYMTAGRF